MNNLNELKFLRIFFEFGIKKPVITLKGNDRGARILHPPKENRCDVYISIFMSSKYA
jgi:hypothetical protein